MTKLTRLTVCGLALATTLGTAMGLFAATGAKAGDNEKSEVEAREETAASEGFTPPLTGAPERRMGAASRELAPSPVECAEPPETSGENPDCAEAAATPPASESEDASGGAQQ